MQLYEESESGYYFKDPMPYEVKGATAEMVVLRYTIANRIAAYYQSLSHDQKDWQEIQQLKATYSQQIGKLVERSTRRFPENQYDSTAVRYIS